MTVIHAVRTHHTAHAEEPVLPSIHPFVAFMALALPLALAAPISAGVVDIAQSPLSQSVPVGATVNVQIVVSTPGPGSQPWDAMDAIISWDPAFLKLTGSTQVGAGAPFFLTGFLPDPDGVNMNIMDGTAIFTALGVPGGNIVAPPAPAQLVVTTLQFLALAPIAATSVDYLPAVGIFGLTRVLLGGADVTGDTSSVAFVQIVAPCPPSAHDCYTVGGPGCSDLDCCEAVCAVDASCCDIGWDAACVDEAHTLCDGCGDPLAGSCFCAHPNTGCDDAACCDLVCTVDPFCCEVQWDGDCAGLANSFCPCRVDFNHDGIVDGADLGLLLAAWGTDQCPFDANGSGDVDGADLGLMLAAWGPCP